MNVRHVYAGLLTRVHVAWLERRDRSPWPWIVLLAGVVALLRPH